MISGERALRLINQNCERLPVNYGSPEKSVGRILADDIYAKEDSPPFDNSAMDGYAVRSADVTSASKETPTLLPLQACIPAGAHLKERLKPGKAIKIMTGAPLPVGADTVAIREGTESKNDEEVRVLYAPQLGDHLRHRGEDIRKGDLLLKSGTVIRPYEVALLAAQGVSSIPLIQKPKAAIVVTGNELVETSAPLEHGQIRNSNGPALASALARWGVDIVYQCIARDNQEDLLAKLKKASELADLICISGGVSVGDYDYTRPVLKKIGVKEIFWKISIKPGKPLFFGKLNKKVFFGLPGNPISALVCLEEFVRPAVEKMKGLQSKHPSYHMKGVASNDYPLPKNRQQYLFCHAKQEKNQFSLQIIRPQGSAMIGMACRANALALSPIGARSIKKGEPLPFRWLK